MKKIFYSIFVAIVIIMFGINSDLFGANSAVTVNSDLLSSSDTIYSELDISVEMLSVSRFNKDSIDCYMVFLKINQFDYDDLNIRAYDVSTTSDVLIESAESLLELDSIDKNFGRDDYGDDQYFGGYLCQRNYPSLTSSSTIILKFYDSTTYIGESSEISLANIQDGEKVLSDSLTNAMNGLIGRRESKEELLDEYQLDDVDTDGDGVVDMDDPFPTIRDNEFDVSFEIVADDNKTGDPSDPSDSSEPSDPEDDIDPANLGDIYSDNNEINPAAGASPRGGGSCNLITASPYNLTSCLTLLIGLVFLGIRRRKSHQK